MTVNGFADTGMSILVSDALAKQVGFDEDTMWVDLVDGRTLGVPLAYFPHLLNATPAERMKFRESINVPGIPDQRIENLK